MDDNAWQKVNRKKSMKDLTQRISKSVFITNFPDHFSARDLWNVCVAYAGKKFAFVRFMKVDNVDRLIENLCTIWIGSYCLRANPVRFQRDPLTSNSQLKKRIVVDNKNSFASVLKAGNHKPVMSSEPSPAIVLDESCVSEKDLSCSLVGKIKDINALSNIYVILANEGNHKPVMSSEPSPAIVLDESCVSEKDLSCSLVGKIKDINALSNIYVILANEGFDNVSLTYLGGYWVLINVESISSEEKLSKHVGVASWFVELIPASNSFVSENRLVWVSLEGLPIKLWNKAAFAKIVFPWGSLANMDAEDDSALPFKKVCVVTNHNTIINDKIKIIIKGQLYWIRVKELNAWTPKTIDEGSDTSSSDEEDIDCKVNAFDSDKELDHVSESSCMNDYKMKANTQDFSNEQRPILEDPFEIYELLNKKKDKEVSKKQVSKD
nr:hypothetical protein [Tanacetum cinerariifolium]